MATERATSPATVTTAAEELERFIRLRDTGDRGLRDELVESYRWLALHCARRFRHRGEPFEDLVQVAHLGILRAVERFDPDAGNRFTSFATPTVLGELRRHFRDTTWAVKAPRRLKELSIELSKIVQSLSQELGRAPRVEEIAERANTGVEEVLEALEAGAGYRTSHLVEEGDGEHPMQARLGIDDPGYARSEVRIALRQLVVKLPERERRIIHLRFVEGLTQSEIADKIGVSQVHVSRILHNTLERLQIRLGATT
jgi:RNA polymerase sigma-B factor